MFGTRAESSSSPRVRKAGNADSHLRVVTWVTRAGLSCGLCLLLVVLLHLVDWVHGAEDCSAIVCQHGGVCFQDPAQLAHCRCPADFTGQLCEFELLCAEVTPPVHGTVLYTTSPRYANFSSSTPAEYTVGTIARYSCPLGFRTTIFDVSSMCTVGRTWVPSPPSECQFACNSTTCPSAEVPSQAFNSCCSLIDRPIGCCRSGTKMLLEDRFHGITGDCSFSLQKSLIPCENELPLCYESLARHNYSCPDLHGCRSRINDPENSSSSIVCPPIAGPGAELCQSSCEGFYCLQREYYCLAKPCANSKSLSQIALSETRMNCDLEKLFLGVSICSGTAVNVKCHGGSQGSATSVLGNCTAAMCPSAVNPERTQCCMLQGQPVGCCTTAIETLLSNRFRYISGQCAADLGRQLQPCGHRLVQCLSDPINFNFTCPDSHGCLVSQETPSHCQQFAGAGARWCTSERCSARGCTTSSFCMSKSCSSLEQRYRMARSDALLKCDSDMTFSRTPCSYANSSIACDGDTIKTSARTTDECTDVLADDPSSYCASSSPSSVCCKIGAVSLGCCRKSTQSRLQTLRAPISSATCMQALYNLLPPAGRGIISSIESPSTATPFLSIPTFGMATNSAASAAQCVDWLGKGYANCTLTVTETTIPQYKQKLTFCLPATCRSGAALAEVAKSEVDFRCLFVPPPCPLLGYSIECRDVSGNMMRYETNSGAEAGASETSTALAVAIGGSVAGVLLVAGMFLLLLREFRHRSSQRMDDKIELTNK